MDVRTVSVHSTKENPVKKALLLFMLLAVSTSLLATTTTTKSMNNLQAAFNGESNAHARYIEFAKQADKEGYPSVAALFRAAARAEEVHAANHAKVLKTMGMADIKPVLDKVEVKSTRENLQAAVKGETYERDVMYPDFLKVARSEANASAIETFNMAKSAEAEHAKLYGEALAKLDSLKGQAGVKYYVCTICGFTVTKIDFEKCPVCFNPKEKYVAIG